METLSWIFDGIGTEIISGIMGALLGGFAGYKIGINKTYIKQSQKSGNFSNQSQTGIQNGNK